MSSSSPDVEQIVTNIAPESERQRRSALLRPLNNSLIVLSLLGLVVMLLNGSDSLAYTLVASSLLLNLLVAWLERAQYSSIAAQLFALWVNIGIVSFCAINLLLEKNIQQGVIFACLLAMSVMLAGLLLGVHYAFIAATANTLVVFGLLISYYRLFGTDPNRTPLNQAIASVVPISAFLVIVAVITWLYQRALAQSEQRLGLARQRILRDELLRRDMAVARELQQRLYPPPPLLNPGLQIASRSEPARETSGDFYDFIQLDEGQLGIVVADVAGKSIAAALVMALARGTLRSEATRHDSPAEVLRAANDTLCRDQSVRQFITAFYGVLDAHTLTLRFSNAGHPFPLLRRGARLEEIEICGMPLGARADALYVEQTVQLEPGDQLFLISDGLIEERDNQRELFGYERLYATIAAADRCNSEQALDALWQAVTRFRGATEQDDDITLVVVQVADAPVLNAVASVQSLGATEIPTG